MMMMSLLLQRSICACSNTVVAASAIDANTDAPAEVVKRDAEKKKKNLLADIR